MRAERVGLWTTVVFAVVAVVGLAVGPVRGVAALVDMAMFLVGAALMGWALVVAAGRSRTVTIDIGSLFFSQAPRLLKLCFVAQIVVGLATAGARPNTGSAFGVLAPVFGLGLMGLTGARHGTFPARDT